MVQIFLIFKPVIIELSCEFGWLKLRKCAMDFSTISRKHSEDNALSEMELTRQKRPGILINKSNYFMTIKIIWGILPHNLQLREMHLVCAFAVARNVNCLRKGQFFMSLSENFTKHYSIEKRMSPPLLPEYIISEHTFLCWWTFLPVKTINVWSSFIFTFNSAKLPLQTKKCSVSDESSSKKHIISLRKVSQVEVTTDERNDTTNLSFSRKEEKKLQEWHHRNKRLWRTKRFSTSLSWKSLISWQGNRLLVDSQQTLTKTRKVKRRP